MALNFDQIAQQVKLLNIHDLPHLVVHGVEHMDHLYFNHLRFVDWIHCIYAACLFKDAGADKSGFFQRLIGLAIQTFGGGIWVGLLLGQPPALLCSNAYVINFLISYFFVFHVPLVHRILKLPIVWPLVMALDVFNTAFSIMQGGVNRALGATHSIQGSVIGLIILGTFAGIGGSTTASLFNMSKPDWRVQTPATFQAALPFGIFPSFVAAAFYALVRICQAGTDSLFGQHCLPQLAVLSELSLDEAQAIVVVWLLVMKLADVVAKSLKEQKKAQAAEPAKTPSVAPAAQQQQQQSSSSGHKSGNKQAAAPVAAPAPSKKEQENAKKSKKNQ